MKIELEFDEDRISMMRYIKTLWRIADLYNINDTEAMRLNKIAHVLWQAVKPTRSEMEQLN